MQKHICSVKLYEKELYTTHYKHEAPTARLLALHLMSPMRRGRVVDAGYCMMNEIEKWPQKIST